MSRSYVNNVTALSPLRGAARTIHILLADHADDLGLCWPKQETLAEKAACSVRHVKKVIKQLVELGWLEVFQRPGVRGRYNAYRLKLKVNSSSPSKVNSSSPSKVNSSSPSIEEEPREEPVEPQQPPSPAAKREEDDMIVGGLPPDEPEEALTPEEAGGGLPRRGTQAWVLRYFHNEAVKAGHPDYNEKGLMRVIKQVREKYGYSYDEVEVLMRRFFVGHEHDVRTTRTNLTWRFKDLVPTLVKETSGTVENKRSGRVSNRNVVLPHELVEKMRKHA